MVLQRVNDATLPKVLLLCALFEEVSMRTLLFLSSLLISVSLFSQKSIIRGNIYDGGTGEPVAFATVQIMPSGLGTTTDFDGFFTISNINAGTYELKASFIGYDTAKVNITLDGKNIEYVRLTLNEGVSLDVVEISAGRTQARTDVQVSKVTLTPRDIKALPSTGGDADLAQYLPVLPGIVSTGDQGGQIYIRGGAPIQNLVLLDGVTIFNPFHSIGFYSVFETEAIQNVDVLTGGFGAQYGGRLSAVVDINTKTGNRKNFGGLVGLSPFQGRVMLEGPMTKYDATKGGSVSYLFSGKRGYLDQTSKQLYNYANDSLGLPYNFTDLYGKISVLGTNGSKVDFFSFNYADNANFPAVAYSWNTFGAGMNFKLVPTSSNLIMDGSLSYSNYDSQLGVEDQDPRTSELVNYVAKINFTSFSGRNTLRYGFSFNGIRTDFKFTNGFGSAFQLANNNSEIATYFTFKRAWDAVVFEPGVRLQYYASQSEAVLEPRLGLKYNATDWMRFKFAGGLYSQNLLSTVSETDVVNLFVGFIAGPEQTIFDQNGDPLTTRLQRSIHAIGGVEFDLGPGILLNVEPYLKRFTQLLAINRNRRTSTESTFIRETGDAVGLDVSIAYDRERLYFFGAYSLGKVTRDDGEQVYPTIFDRRHNANILASYALGSEKEWELGFRYNFGTGFPFTGTRGFYTRENFDGGLNTDILENNPDLGILFSTKRNGNRLPNYHRADVSLKREFELKNDLKLEVVASVTNASNRANIFFVDRVNNDRVDQLPILPSIGATFKW